MRKFLTPCNIAIVIALGCLSYIVVQSHYERQATQELYKTVLELNKQAVATAASASTILGQMNPLAESEDVPPIDEPERPTVARIFKPRRLKKPKRNPCEEVFRIERIGSYEVRYRDLKCLNAANYEEQ